MLLSIVIATDFIYAFSPYYVYSQPVLSYILERTKIPSGFRVVSHKLRLPVVQYVVLGVFLSRIYKGNAMTVNQ